MNVSTHLSLLRALRNPADQQAVQLFALRYQEHIKVWCKSRCVRHGVPAGVAEDVAEEVSRRVVDTIQKRMHSYQEEKYRKGGYRKWLWMVTRNATVDYWRSKKRERAIGDTAMSALLADAAQPEELDAAEELAHGVDALMIHELLDQLKPQVILKVGQRNWDIAMAAGLADGRKKKRDPDTAALAKAMDIAQRYGLSPGRVSQIKADVRKVIKEMISGPNDTDLV